MVQRRYEEFLDQSAEYETDRSRAQQRTDAGDPEHVAVL
jgi:hypothetical protein